MENEKEPTVEEMVKWIIDLDLAYRAIGLHHPYLVSPVTDKDKAIFQAIRKHLVEKPKVSREWVKRFFPCRCDSAWIDRGLKMPGCPYHDTEWEWMLTELGIEITESEGGDVG